MELIKDLGVKKNKKRKQMKKEYECCVPKEVKDEFLSNAIRKRAIFEFMSGLSKAGVSDLETTREMLEQVTEIEKKEYWNWREVASIYPELNSGKFAFNSATRQLLYYEEVDK